MRQILFKAKAENSPNEWVESMTIAKGTIKRKRDDVFMEIGDNKWKGIIPDTLSQLLFEFNNNKMFQNDIITCDKINMNYVLIWNSKTQSFCVFTTDDYKYIIGEYELMKNSMLESKASLNTLWIKKNAFYTVGNIFDNPELLK